MRWRSNHTGDFRIVRRFLWLPKALYRRVKQGTQKDPEGEVTKEKQARWLETCRWLQKWGGITGVREEWVDICWEADCPRETRKPPIGPPT